MRHSLFFLLVPALLLSSAVSAEGGVGINSTRLIYPADAKSINVGMRNTSDVQPYLIKTSVSTKPDKVVPAPFLVNPSLFRIEPKSTRQTRIVFKGSDLPQDRESVFYFTGTAIPASSADKGPTPLVKGAMQIALGTTIKLFYRPVDLPTTSKEAQEKLKFTAVSGGVRVTNSSPYFVTISSLNINDKELSLDDTEEKMIAPFSYRTYQTAERKGKVSGYTIDDFGGYQQISASIQ